MKIKYLLNKDRRARALDVLTERNVFVVTDKASQMFHQQNFGDVFARYCLRMAHKTFAKATKQQDKFRRGRV